MLHQLAVCTVSKNEMACH